MYGVIFMERVTTKCALYLTNDRIGRFPSKGLIINILPISRYLSYMVIYNRFSKEVYQRVYINRVYQRVYINECISIGYINECISIGYINECISIGYINRVY
jgi:hypothetical protein